MQKQSKISLQSIMKSERKKKEGMGMQAELIALFFVCLETDAEQISLHVVLSSINKQLHLVKSKAV